MQVTIHGPNLTDQTKGQFHVHSEGCRDNQKEIRQNGSVGPWTIDAISQDDVVLAVYPPDEFGYDASSDEDMQSYRLDFHFEPCVFELAPGGGS